MVEPDSPSERDVHHVLNEPASDPDLTEWPDPYDKRPIRAILTPIRLRWTSVTCTPRLAPRARANRTTRSIPRSILVRRTRTSSGGASAGVRVADRVCVDEG
jgi:hypothetical protein